MSDGMLQDIIDIERQIEADLVVERDKANKWLDQQKAQIDQQAEQDIEMSSSTAARNSQDRCQSARAAGADRIREMRRHVRQVKAVTDAELRQIVQRHLAQIIGGVRHDHPDGQN